MANVTCNCAIPGQLNAREREEQRDEEGHVTWAVWVGEVWVEARKETGTHRKI